MYIGMGNTRFLCASLRTIEYKLFYLLFNILTANVNYWYNIFSLFFLCDFTFIVLFDLYK